MDNTLLHVGYWAKGQLVDNAYRTAANAQAGTHQTANTTQTNIDSAGRVPQGQQAVNMLERFIHEPAAASGCVEVFMGSHSE